MTSSVGLGGGVGAYSFLSERSDVVLVHNSDPMSPLNVFLLAPKGVGQPGRPIHFLDKSCLLQSQGPARPQILDRCRSARSQIGHCVTPSGMQLARFHHLEVRDHPFVGKMMMDDPLRLLHYKAIETNFNS